MTEEPSDWLQQGGADRPSAPKLARFSSYKCQPDSVHAFSSLVPESRLRDLDVSRKRAEARCNIQQQLSRADTPNDILTGAFLAS